jgi:hypothetical protein
VRDAQVTLQDVSHPRRQRMGRDWPVMSEKPGKSSSKTPHLPQRRLPLPGDKLNIVTALGIPAV